MCIELRCIILMIGALLVGCSDPSGVELGMEELAGEYELVQYQGESVPVEAHQFTRVFPDEEVVCSVILVSSTLLLDLDYTYSRTTEQVTECENGWQDDGPDGEEVGSLTVKGDTLTFEYESPLGPQSRRATTVDGTQIVFPHSPPEDVPFLVYSLIDGTR